MNNNNLSLVEIAYREMKNKRKPRTLEKIAKDVFEIKGIRPAEAEKKMNQFIMDFMLSGHFICCGEDKHGKKLWDLKSRQKSSLLDKDGVYLEDLYSDDEEVIKHELNDNIIYKPAKSFDDVEELLSEEYGDEEEDSDYIDEDDLGDDIDVDDEDLSGKDD